LGLCIFIAILLPVTGGRTGAVAAFIFGIKLRHSVPMIILGIMTAGVIVSLFTLGVINF
jgi:uncharacterized membrane protein